MNAFRSIWCSLLEGWKTSMHAPIWEYAPNHSSARFQWGHCRCHCLALALAPRTARTLVTSSGDWVLPLVLWPLLKAFGLTTVVAAPEWVPHHSSFLLSLVSDSRSGASAFDLAEPRSYGSAPRAWETNNYNVTYIPLIICQILF